MTFYEIEVYKAGYDKQLLHKEKTELVKIQLLADLITSEIAHILNNKNPRPKRITEMFPDLFEEENDKKQKMDLEVYKARFRDFASKFNQKRGDNN